MGTERFLIVIPFARIQAYVNHPFRLYTGERLADMVESVRQNGILLPLIVRRIVDDPNYVKCWPDTTA